MLIMIALVQPIAAKSLVISEIMWGLDDDPNASHSGLQLLPLIPRVCNGLTLYNTTDKAINAQANFTLFLRLSLRLALQSRHSHQYHF